MTPDVQVVARSTIHFNSLSDTSDPVSGLSAAAAAIAAAAAAAAAVAAAAAATNVRLFTSLSFCFDCFCMMPPIWWSRLDTGR